MLRSSSLLLALPFFLTTACATVPLPGRGVRDQPVLPAPKPLMEGRGQVVSPKDKRASDRVKLETPAKGGKPGTKTADKQQSLSPAAMKAKLQEAEDKAQSARSLAQSAQTPEDWKLVAQQWTKAIELLKPLPTQNNPIAPQVQQALADAQSGLNRTQQAQSAPKSTSNAPIEFDRSKSGKSQGLIYGDTRPPVPQPVPQPNHLPVPPHLRRISAILQEDLASLSRTSFEVAMSHCGAVPVSTGWRTLCCDTGRGGVHPRKSRLKTNRCKQHQNLLS